MKKIALSFVLLAAFPAFAQQDYTPLQQYLYNESGYAPPAIAAAPVPDQNYMTAYVPVQTIDNDQYYDEPQDDSSSDSDSLRNMLTSSGN